jgi:phosphoenolpyruvate synthase/pyruvate phosphate dikinase
MILDTSSKEKIALGAQAATNQNQLVVPLKQVNLQDIAQVGGKNASLGEMLQQLLVQGINVPNGFATTAVAYRYFIHQYSGHFFERKRRPRQKATSSFTVQVYKNSTLRGGDMFNILQALLDTVGHLANRNANFC